jgi:hypothetical protein
MTAQQIAKMVLQKEARRNNPQVAATSRKKQAAVDDVDITTKNRVLTALLGPAYAGLAAPKGRGWGSYYGTAQRGSVKGLEGAGIGALIGGGVGTGIGALISALSKGSIPMKSGLGAGAAIGGGLGLLGGADYGSLKGQIEGMERGWRGQPTFGDISTVKESSEKLAAFEHGVKCALDVAGDDVDIATKNRVLTALLGPIYAGAAAPEGKGWSSFGKSYGRGVLGGLGGELVGGIGGAGLGTGIGALTSALSRGRVSMRDALRAGALLGGYLGSVGGGAVGGTKGLISGMERGWRGQPMFGDVE